MTFQDILSQAREWLQRDKRVTYHALQRQFALDETSLTAVKEALLFARLVVDEDGRGLVWAGETTSPAAVPSHRAIAESRFQALLRAVIAFLYREQRVTYRTIKYVFDIEEALLHELQTELTFRRLAMDEDGKGLVWTGAAQPASSSEQAALDPSDPATLAAYSPPDLPDEPAKLPEPARSTPDAERRQLTVMFCDLADSTALAQQLDPEELREVIRAYQATAADAIHAYGGHIAQYLGDGLLICFGWPMAHEDDAQRAIHAGLGIVEAITTSLNTRLEHEYGVRLHMRLGIHTGPVVVGEMGGGGRHEHLATGDTVNIAARLESLAAPNTVVISAATAY